MFNKGLLLYISLTLLLIQTSKSVIVPKVMSEWMAANGIRANEKIMIDHQAMKIIALSDIEANEELISLPSNLAFRNTIKQDDPSIEYLKKESQSEKVEAKIPLVLSLLQEQKSKVSKWNGWFASLPSELDSALLYSEEDLSLLKNHDAFARLETHRKALNSTWDTMIKNIVTPTTQISDFLYHYSLVFGRRTIIQETEEVEGVPVLLPAISSARHCSLPNALIKPRMLVEEFVKEKLFEPNTVEFVLLASEKIPSKTEICIQYGFQDNYESFVSQGVIQNIEDLDSLTFIVESPTDESFKKSLEKLKIDKLQFKLTPFSIPFSLIKYLRLKNGANVDEETVFELLNSGKPVSLENDRLSLGELLATIRRVQNIWGPSVEDDLKLLQQQNMTERQKSVVSYRLREKGVLVGVEKIVRQLWDAWLG